MDAIEYFRELIPLSSPSKKENLVRDYLKDKYRSFGYNYTEDSVGNILFYKTDGGRKTIFSAHQDTVDLALYPKVKEDDEYIFTDGSTALGADDKAGLAVCLALAETYTKDDLAFLFFISEETGLYGSSLFDKKLFFSKITPIGVFVLDASGKVGTVINKTVGKTRLTLTFKGKSAHAGHNPENGISAIFLASTFVVSSKFGHPTNTSTSNIGSLISTGSTNVVPALATLEMEVRSYSDDERYKLITQYKKEALKAAKENGGRVDFSEEDLYSAYSLDSNSSLIKKVEKASKKNDIEFSLRENSGGSDANNLISKGIPSVVLSTGYENAHSVNERIKKSEIVNLYNLIYSIAEDN